MLGVTCVVLLCVLAVIFRGKTKNIPADRPDQGANSATLSREQSEKLLALRDRAVAALENQDFAAADEMLSAIIEQVPHDPFGPRNLTICRELALAQLDVSRDPASVPAMLTKARSVVEALHQLEPDSYVPHVLDARISLRANELDKAEASLKRATELAPKSAPVWYDLYSLKPPIPGEPPSADVVNALRHVHDLEPDNLFVLKDWLPLLAQLKDPSFADAAEQAKETLQPFADIIKTHSRVDVIELLDVVAKAAREEKWPLAQGRSMAIRNIMVSEAARDDRYVKLDSLEYVLHDFGPKFYDRADLAPASNEEATSVSFALAPEDAQPQFPSGVRDVATIDLDLDGRLDGAVLLSDRIVASLPITAKSDAPKPVVVSVIISGDFQHLLAVDLDDDVDSKLRDRPKDAAGCLLADPDLIAFGSSGVRLFENRLTENNTREFSEKPAGDAIGSLRNVLDVVPVDLDLDGDLDFFTIASDGIRLWSNRSNWSFEEITTRSKLPPPDFGPTAAVVCDWDKDTDLDIVVAGTNGVGVLESLRHGRFRWRELDGDFASLKNSRALLTDDYDHNGSWDLLGAGDHGLNLVLTQTTSAGIVSAKQASSLASTPHHSVTSLDFDNDGVRDLAASDDKGLSLWRGDGRGGFETFAMPPILGASFAMADVDRDGDEDLLAATSADSKWHLNNGGNTNGWLDISLLAQQIKPNEQNYSKRVNHAGIGSTIELKAGGRYQAQVVTGPITHFGLGRQKQADVVRVIWTNGVPRNLINPEPNLHVCEEQKLVGSCPYLYTWNGEKFVFVTDLLWNSPIGLKFAESVVAPWREWEYLKIDGDKLKPKDGEYQLKITEELWEAGYFDQIKLFAIDHPAEADIYTNEKVGPASMAEHKIHTVRTPRIPVAAKDTQGRNVLDQVKARDGIYTKTYDRKLAQGLATDHWLELDLGSWDEVAEKENKPAQITLFLTGWVYPTSTSLNVQFSQNPDGAQPRPPALHAVDTNGMWREVRPFMGFPGGKTKTIAIDISDVFAPGSTDHRLRIVTNMEFYWDAAFFTVDEPSVEFRQQELTLLRANLHDRGGISFREYDAGNGPEYFHHDRLVPGLHWPPMAGAFTRFGEVRELLTARDDRLLVLGCNDELSLAFAEPSESLPAGWVRDFVIFNVGWDKDCDMNTVYGEAVEPLPFEAMTTYAHQDGRSRPLDDDYHRYLKVYQTRGQPRPQFWSAIRQRPNGDWRSK